MSTEEFLSKYGWWKPIWYNPKKHERRWNGKYDKNGSKQIQHWVYCECCVCHEADWVRWAPRITDESRRSRSVGEIGYWVCNDCKDYKAMGRKTVETLGPEGRKQRKQKAEETLGPEGRRAVCLKRAQTLGKEELHRIGKQGYNTRLEKYGGPRNPVERLIDEEFGSVHVRIVDKLPGFDVRPEREIDNYFPDLKIGINIDEWSGHSESSDSEWKKSRPQGEHKYVDDYFKNNFGITIYHIPEHYKGELLSDWALGLLQERIKSILDGSYEGPTIDVEDPVYGDIKYA